jgi:hypothetical protein
MQLMRKLVVALGLSTVLTLFAAGLLAKPGDRALVAGAHASPPAGAAPPFNVLRVYDGLGNDVGLYAGRDGGEVVGRGGPVGTVAIHVFVNDQLGVIATYSPTGWLSPLPHERFFFESDDCSGQAYFDVAGVAGYSPLRFQVAVAGTTTQEVVVASRIGAGPICNSPIPTPMQLVPLEFFDVADSEVAFRLPPLLYVAPPR